MYKIGGSGASCLRPEDQTTSNGQLPGHVQGQGLVHNQSVVSTASTPSMYSTNTIGPWSGASSGGTASGSASASGSGMPAIIPLVAATGAAAGAGMGLGMSSTLHPQLQLLLRSSYIWHDARVTRVKFSLLLRVPFMEIVLMRVWYGGVLLTVPAPANAGTCIWGPCTAFLYQTMSRDQHSTSTFNHHHTLTSQYRSSHQRLSPRKLWQARCGTNTASSSRTPCITRPMRRKIETLRGCRKCGYLKVSH